MTADEQQLLVSVLDELAEAPAPQTSMDTGLAIRDGRRLRLRRRLAAGGVALTLAAASVGVVAVAMAQRGSDQGPAVPTPGPRWPGSATPHDPLTVPGTFGWLPPGVTADGYWGYPYLGFGLPVDADALGASPAPGSTGRPMLSLYLYPTGGTPTVPPATWVPGTPGMSRPRSHTIPAPDIDGHQAYWASSSATDELDGDRPMLRWRTADGRWAELTAVNFPVQGLAQIMLRTAGGISLGTRPVPMPFSISGWPVPTRVLDVTTSLDPGLPSDPQSWMFGASFDISGYRFDIAVGHSRGAPERGPNPPGETTLWATANGLAYQIHHEGGGKLPAALTAAGGLQGLLNKMTMLGPDQRNWTTDVLR